MKLRETTLGIGLGIMAGAQVASAGGLFLPGAGAVSTSRAGTATVSADDGEALVMNPAGLAKAKGTTITLSAAMISYAMEFQRRGNYPMLSNDTQPYEGMPYAKEKNDASPPLGFGSFQPVPVIAVISDLGGAVEGLHVAAGLYAPNAYPFRDMCTVMSSGGCQKYKFDPAGQAAGTDNIPPPPARYDIMEQEAAVLLPSIAVAYHIPSKVVDIDVGARYSLGFANLKSTTAVIGLPPNYEEWIKQDAVFKVDASDSFISTFGLGFTYRPTPAIEVGANYSYKIDIHAKGSAETANGSEVKLGPNPVVIGPPDDAAARCAKGGTAEKLKACVDLSLPATAAIGARYKFNDAKGKMRGDVEINGTWEHWGVHCDLGDASCTSPSEYRVVVDAVANGALTLRDSYILHGLQDVYGVRVGGSYVLPMDDNELTIRGGVGYETAAAKDGWLRADLDGAARTTIAIGAGYRFSNWQINAGGGVILEGSSSNAGTCYPSASSIGCSGTGVDAPVKDHVGPDPINPLVDASQQTQHPENQGDYKSHYVMFMLGATTWF